MAKPQLSVVVTRRLPEPVEGRLSELFDTQLRSSDAPMTRAQIVEAIKNADVLVPTIGDGHKDIPNCSTSIFWLMADLLGQKYWRVQSSAVSGSNNVHIDIEKLNKILDTVDI